METLKNIIINKKHLKYRREIDYKINSNDSDIERIVKRFETYCANETPIILDEQQIVFLRTISNFCDCFSKEEWDEKRQQFYIHESGYVSNLNPDYESIIHKGLLSFREEVNDYAKREIDALLLLCDKYLEEAKRIGREDIVDMFSWIPRNPARTFKEALQFFRILHFAYLLEGGYQIVAGRIDQIFYPYFKRDMKKGILNEEMAFELIKDFFLSFNIDSDLYDGVQQGDNGQSVVLGGLDINGNECFNELSRLCLLASKENKVIDPKINLRVSSKTPLEIYELASELTKEGLGFPQYLNDDVIIQGLIEKGYEKKDAYNYSVAACWEIIIPKYGFEVVNIGACSFPKVLEKCMIEYQNYDTFEKLMFSFKQYLQEECNQIISQYHALYFAPAPLIESSLSPKYYNFGIHGTGISCAVDSLYAIKRKVFETKEITLKEYVDVVNRDYQGYETLLHELRYEIDKMGHNNQEVDEIACDILSAFCDCLKDKKNCYGGIYRAGTGSAMFYLDHAYEIGTSYDGRRKNEPFSANYSPSIFAKIKGPISIVESFTKPNLIDAMNGGPLTLEFSSSMFDSKDSIHKLAQFVCLFILKGGHQLQCNSINSKDLKDAQKHPEKYKHLIVRIWGWSAYFCELDKQFQDHVIARSEYSL